MATTGEKQLAIHFAETMRQARDFQDRLAALLRIDGGLFAVFEKDECEMWDAVFDVLGVPCEGVLIDGEKFSRDWLFDHIRRFEEGGISAEELIEEAVHFRG
jgi:hypothetical protein